jgi:hypothetical protein
LEVQIQIAVEINILIGPLKAAGALNRPENPAKALKSAKLLQKLTGSEMRHLNFGFAFSII